MATSLGGAQATGMKMMVKNNDATATLKKGTIVAFSSVAASNPFAVFLDGTMNKDYGSGTMQLLDVPYITVTDADAESATPGGVSRLGVVAADIRGGQFGEIITYGFAQVLFGGAVTQGDVFTSNASGLAVDAANGTEKNPVGIALATGVSGALSWAFINCLSPGGVSSTAWHGKAY